MVYRTAKITIAFDYEADIPDDFEGDVSDYIWADFESQSYEDIVDSMECSDVDIEVYDE